MSPSIKTLKKKESKKSQKKEELSRSLSRLSYPFSAIVGQNEFKLALFLSVIDPGIGGILVMGHRGTAKTTAIRALGAVLPEIEYIANCPYHSDPEKEKEICPYCNALTEIEETKRMNVPVVDLPLGVTEDRLVGSIDIEKALKEGRTVFSPGLLAKAHRGFLYIDEVNLLENHLVDLLLDVAVSGVNVVERDNLSIRHPAKIVLIGSGNPEEGDLRPQLLDRFGLHARIKTIIDPKLRVEIVKRSFAYENDPYKFNEKYKDAQKRLSTILIEARKRIPQIKVSEELLKGAADLCVKLNIDGHRGEITLCRASRALAAFLNKPEADMKDLAKVAPLVLRHRLRKDPLDTADDDQRMQKVIEQVLGVKSEGFNDEQELY